MKYKESYYVKSQIINIPALQSFLFHVVRNCAKQKKNILLSGKWIYIWKE